MAVIYLPQDKRFGDIGDALGSLVGSYLENSDTKKTQSGVADILKNTTDPEQAFTQVQGQYGAKGLALLKGLYDAKAPLLKARETEANITKSGAETDRAKAGAAKDTAETSAITSKAPLEMLDLQARIKKTQADTQKAQVDLQTAPDAARKMKADADLAQTNAEMAQHKADLVRIMSDNAHTQSNPLSATGLSDDVWNSLPPAAQSAARMDVSQGDIKGAAEKVAQGAALVQKQEKVSPVNDQTMKVINGASTIGNSAKDVLESVDSGSDKGGPTASLKAWLVEKGLTQGTPEFDKQLAAQHQMLLNSVQSGGGFGGEWKVRLGHKTIPNVTQGPAFQVIETNMILKDRMTELQREKARFEGTNTNTKPIDQAIDQIKPLIDKTETMKGDEYGNLYYLGNMVNPKNLKPIVPDAIEPTQTFKMGDDTITGATINDAALKAKKTPQEILKLYQDHIGGK